MPYDSVKDLPSYVKKYEPKIQRQWMHVFNTVYKKTNSDSRAFKAANSVLKKRMKKEINSQNYIYHLVDQWLGNLKG